VAVLLGFAGLNGATINGTGWVQDSGAWKVGGGSYLKEGEEIPRKSKSGIGTCIPRSHILWGFGPGGRQLILSDIVHWIAQQCVAAALIAAATEGYSTVTLLISTQQNNYVTNTLSPVLLKNLTTIQSFQDDSLHSPNSHYPRSPKILFRSVT